MSTAAIDHLPASLNLKFRQGNDFSITVQIGQKNVLPDDRVVFVPKDLTGSTFELYIAGHNNRGQATVVTPVDGTVSLSLGHEFTSTMRGSNAYELVEIAPDKTRRTLLVGAMKVSTPCDDDGACCECHQTECCCDEKREIVPCNPTGVISINGRTGAVKIDDLIPTASFMTPGIVKVDNITTKVDANGVLSAVATNAGGANGTPYILPDATTLQKGGVIIGSGLRIAAGGVLSSPVATVSQVGLVKPGHLVSIAADGTIDVAGTPIHTHAMVEVGGLQAALDSKPTLGSVTGRLQPSVLPIANTTSPGVVKPDGTTVTIDPDGTIHALSSGGTGGGTVTSVSLVGKPSVAGIISVTGSPVVSSGNLTIALDDQQPHKVLAGPAFGIASAPTFRSLTTDDISDATAIGLTVLKAPTATAAKVALSLANVASTGSYTDLADKPVIPAAYNLPIATTLALGGVKPDGTTIKVDSAGVISGSNTYTLPVANLTTVGGVKPSGNVTVSADGSIDVRLPVSAGTYTLPVANTTVLGGVKQGANVTIDANGVLSATGGYTLPIANATTLGGVKPTGNLTVTAAGALDANLAPYLPLVSTANVTVKAAASCLTMGTDTIQFRDSKSSGFDWDTVHGLMNVDGTSGYNPSNQSYVTKSWSDLNYIGLPSRATANQLLTYNGTTWIPVTPAAGYVLPPATALAIGGVKKGANTTISSDGTIDVILPASAGTYTLPVANSSVLGGVKPSGNITVNANGFMDVNVPSAAGTYVLPAANKTTLGGVIPSGNISVTSGGVIDADLTGYLAKSVVPNTFYGVPLAAVDSGGSTMGIYNDKTVGMFIGTNEIALTQAGEAHLITENGVNKSNVKTTSASTVIESTNGSSTSHLTIAAGGVTISQPAGATVVPTLALTAGIGDTRYINTPSTATANQIISYNGSRWVAANLPASYVLPVANATGLGGVKQGANTTIAVDGTISVVLPAAANLTGYIAKPAGATANQVLTYNGTTWISVAPTLGLTKVDADGYYQPILKNFAYTEAVPVPSGMGVTMYEGEILKDITGVQGSGGSNATFLNGVTHHATLPGVPFGTMQGSYYSDPATGGLVSSRTSIVDSDSVRINSRSVTLNQVSEIRVRYNTIVNNAADGALSSCTSLTGTSGLTYAPPSTPGGFPLTLTSVLNKQQLDDNYLPKPANATAGQIIMSNGTGWGPAAFGKITLVDAPTINWAADPLKVAVVTLTTTRNMAFPTGLIPGAAYNLIVVQGIANCSLNWDTKFFFPNKAKPVLSTAQYSIDIFSFIYDGTNLYGTMQKSFGTGI